MPGVAHHFRVYAHRGASAVLPENTIAAFQRGLDDGADALEMDLRLTADGVLVVHHDADGRRTCGQPQRIRDTTFAEIRSWDAGAGFRSADGGAPHAGAGHRVPSFVEVLSALPPVPLVVDVKSGDPAAVDSLLQVLVDAKARHRVVISSFHGGVVQRARRSGVPGPTALTRTEVAALRLLPVALARRLVAGQVAAVPLKAAGLRLDHRRFLRRARVLDLRVDFWVVNRPEVARLLLDKGATGVMTDDPAALASLRTPGARPSPAGPA